MTTLSLSGTLMATMSCASRNAGIDNSFSATSKAYKISKIKPVARYGSLSFKCT